jgi:hypothetical protein
MTPKGRLGHDALLGHRARHSTSLARCGCARQVDRFASARFERSLIPRPCGRWSRRTVTAAARPVLLLRGSDGDQEDPLAQGAGRDWLLRQLAIAWCAVEIVSVYQRTVPHSG